MNSLAWMNFHLDYSWNYVRSLSKNSQNMERATAFHVLMYDGIITNIKLQHQNRVISFKCLHEMISFWASERKRLCWRYCFQINTMPICTTLLSILIMFLLCFICFNIFRICFRYRWNSRGAFIKLTTTIANYIKVCVFDKWQMEKEMVAEQCYWNSWHNRNFAHHTIRQIIKRITQYALVGNDDFGGHIVVGNRFGNWMTFEWHI